MISSVIMSQPDCRGPRNVEERIRSDVSIPLATVSPHVAGQRPSPDLRLIYAETPDFSIEDSQI